MMNRPVLLLVGASSAIAQAVKDSVVASGAYDVFAISRSVLNDEPGVRCWQTDYSTASLTSVFANIAGHRRVIERVVIANGVLHSDVIFPEKKLSDCREDKMADVYQVNCIVPTLCLQNVVDMLPKQSTCRIAVLSARVGSISDNRLGGWHSYRASKSALNMVLKSVFLELKRSHPAVRLMAFHPGTTVSPLSQPFLSNVPVDKRFSPEFVASTLLDALSALTDSTELAYLDWQHRAIPW